MLAIPKAKDLAVRSSFFATAPSSVISECSPRPHTPRYSSSELLTFGDEYDENILQVIHRHLELDTHHSVAYIGPMKGDLVPKIEKHFCLSTPITVLFPGGVTYKDINQTTRRLALKIATTGADEYFSEISGETPGRKRRFDRILVDNSVQKLCNFEKTFEKMKKCLHLSGKILILHRPSSMTTLPYFKKAKQILSNTEIPFMKIITALQKTGCEVQWDLEHVPIRIERLKWIAMLRNRYPDELEIMSDMEIEEGIRELLSGSLSYLTSEMELEDRLILITGAPPVVPGKFTGVQRIISRPQLPYSELLDLEYTLTLTEHMKKLI